MKKVVIITAVFLVGLVALWIVARATNILEYYVAPTAANEPTYAQDAHFWASKLKTPGRYDFVCFATPDGSGGRNVFRVYRVIGLGGETVAIKHGVAYVNGHDVDTALVLKHMYRVSNNALKKLQEQDSTLQNDIVSSNDSETIVSLDTAQIRACHIDAVKYVLLPDTKDDMIYNAFGRYWNQDNFGPITIPKDCYFVLGDNRSNAYDSRYLGCIPAGSIKGTVLQ